MLPSVHQLRTRAQMMFLGTNPKFNDKYDDNKQYDVEPIKNVFRANENENNLDKE